MGYKGTKFRSILCKCKECNKEFYEYKSDNLVTNLILFPNQSEHAKFHDFSYKYIIKNNLLEEYTNFFIKNGGECVKITR